jgi:hypothetical protein
VKKEPAADALSRGGPLAHRRETEKGLAQRGLIALVQKGEVKFPGEAAPKALVVARGGQAAVNVPTPAMGIGKSLSVTPRKKGTTSPKRKRPKPKSLRSEILSALTTSGPNRSARCLGNPPLQPAGNHQLFGDLQLPFATQRGHRTVQQVGDPS